jgi:O-antigen/teichoic acid export membrane protein
VTQGRVRRNLIANFASSLWLSLLSLAFFPLYIKYLGVEAYGLIGAFTAIQSFSALVDAGLSTTLNRELARLSTDKDGAPAMRDLVRTLEVVYWALSISAALVLAVAAPVAARYWFHREHLSAEEVSRAVVLMGINFALTWPSSVYQGGLMGLQKQVSINVVTFVVGGLRVLGTVVVLTAISPTLDAFFTWQIVTSILQTGAAGMLLWRELPASDTQGHFNLVQLRSVRRFAAGVVGITLLALLLQQSDKLILSKLVSLSSFGYYTFAAVVAGSLARIVGPIHTAFFPRFSELAGIGDQAGLAAEYHRACQLVSVAVLPAALVLAIFAPEILRLWTRNPDLVRNSASLVTVLVIGNALHALVYLPYALQLAHGWTRLAFTTNLIAVIALVPAIALSAARWGAIGAAFTWLALTSAYVMVQVPLMHRRLLRGELSAWYIHDVAKPFVGAAATASAGWWLIRSITNPIPLFTALTVISCLTFAAAALTIPWMRIMAYSNGQRLWAQASSWRRFSTL